MDEHIILTREEAHHLLDHLWLAYELASGSDYQVLAMELIQQIEMLERRIWG